MTPTRKLSQKPCYGYAIQDSGLFDNYRDCLSSKLFMSLVSCALDLFLMASVRCCHHTPTTLFHVCRATT
ncbi:hypothetical protein A0H81_10497 [Grifola frondosa]|uniref:Uncharacterized protein n=1 Tax=Grifola frondosa TaxID=5627 RepID=A0A1C7LXT1_GRIFR|nr:hypothetical protein A0H81_10497 [Grifola frondosa]